MVCASTATARMRGALARISSGVSSKTPSGAAGIPGVVGALEWHAAQRRATITRTSAKETDRKSTRLNSSHLVISYAVFCLKKKKKKTIQTTCDMTKL